MAGQRLWLKELRRSRGLTQRGICKLLKISVRSYYRIETMGCFSEPDAMRKVADFFGIDTELFGMGKDQRRAISRAIMMQHKRPDRPYNPDRVILRVDADGNVFGNYRKFLKHLAELEEIEGYGDLYTV